MFRRIVFLGPPGCGKGTYAKHVSPLLGAEHVSTGDLIRAEARDEAPFSCSVVIPWHA